MKKTLIHAAIAATAALAAAGAMAQPYVGGSVGQSDYNVDGASDNKDTAFKLFGGWMFNPNFGVEAALFDLGKAQGSVALPLIGNVSAEAKVRGVGVYGLAALPLDQFSVFAKAGFAYSRAEVSASSAFGGGSETESKFNPAFGVGASYAFTKNIGARVEWERFRIEYPSSQKEDLDLISVGVTYTF